MDAAPDELPSLDTIAVLVVEDEADNREMLAEALKLAGARVVSAASVREALEAITRSRPDVIVSDITMPDEDGYGLIRQVRSFSDSERIAAIALTGHARREDATRAAEAGFDMHLAKPIDPVELCVAVARLAGDRGRRSH